MPGRKDTEEVKDDTMNYQIEGLLICYQILLLLCDTPISIIQEKNGFCIILR